MDGVTLLVMALVVALTAAVWFAARRRALGYDVRTATHIFDFKLASDLRADRGARAMRQATAYRTHFFG
jgi:hypothetical protein